MGTILNPRGEERAVSPVIGVILMVAITVILAAVIASFVLGLDGPGDFDSPKASFDMEYSEGGGTGDGELTITHTSGDTLTVGDLSLKGSSFTSETGDVESVDTTYPSPSSEIEAGDEITLRVNSGDTIRLIWEGDENTAELTRWDGPDA